MVVLVVVAAVGLVAGWMRYRGRHYRQAERIGNAEVYAQAGDARFPAHSGASWQGE